MLLLDAGSVFASNAQKSGCNKGCSKDKSALKDESAPKLASEISLKVMHQMGYDAMNVGESEFVFGTDFLKNASADAAFPLITSNLIYKDSQKPFGEKYLIKPVGKIKVGILGIMPETSPESALLLNVPENLEIIPPETALKAIIPEIREKADVVILLSQCGYDDTVSLISSTEGIDFAICGQQQKRSAKPENPAAEAKILQASYRGTALGVLKLSIDESGKVIVTENKSIKLDGLVKSDEQITKMIADAEEAMKEKKRREFQEEISELHKLSPQEYVEMMLKKQSEERSE